jgi:hypothetical protein
MSTFRGCQPLIEACKGEYDTGDDVFSYIHLPVEIKGHIFLTTFYVNHDCHPDIVLGAPFFDQAQTFISSFENPILTLWGPFKNPIFVYNAPPTPILRIFELRRLLTEYASNAAVVPPPPADRHGLPPPPSESADENDPIDPNMTVCTAECASENRLPSPSLQPRPFDAPLSKTIAERKKLKGVRKNPSRTTRPQPLQEDNDPKEREIRIEDAMARYSAWPYFDGWIT